VLISPYTGLSPSSPPTLLALVGLAMPESAIELLAPVAHVGSLVYLLFLGPLMLSGVNNTQNHEDTTDSNNGNSSIFPSWQFVRDIFVGPIVEEIVFRGCMLPLLYIDGWSMPLLVFVSPLIFGVAHAHHVLYMMRHNGETWKTALMNVAFQFSYTWIFGVFAAFVLVRSGSLLACITAHAICNSMGFVLSLFLLLFYYYFIITVLLLYYYFIITLLLFYYYFINNILF
jgi:prenyl protein peptidase